MCACVWVGGGEVDESDDVGDDEAGCLSPILGRHTPASSLSFTPPQPYASRLCRHALLSIGLLPTALAPICWAFMFRDVWLKLPLNDRRRILR
jgi:hypothetical protein